MQFNFKGKYDPAQSYYKKDVVSYQLTPNDAVRFYFCLTDHTSSTPQTPSPSGDTNFWGFINTLSNFPNTVDTFMYRTSVQAQDKPEIDRLNELFLKSNLTTSEADELNTLTVKYRNKYFTAEDANAIQQSITNMQMFFKNNVEGYINSMVTQVDTAKDNALNAIEQKKNGVIDYLDGTEAGEMRNDIGVMADLTTVDKESLVRAINEVNAKSPADASTTQKGIVQLSNSTSSTSETMAATSKAVKDAELNAKKYTDDNFRKPSEAIPNLVTNSSGRMGLDFWTNVGTDMFNTVQFDNTYGGLFYTSSTGNHYLDTTNPIGVDPGGIYHLQAMFSTLGIASGFVRVQVINTAKNSVVATISADMNTAWHRKTTTVTIPAGVTSVYVRMSSEGASAGNKHFTRIKFAKTNLDTAYTDEADLNALLQRRGGDIKGDIFFTERGTSPNMKHGIKFMGDGTGWQFPIMMSNGTPVAYIVDTGDILLRNADGTYTSVKQSGIDAKQRIVDAINSMGGSASANDSWAVLATKVQSLSQYSTTSINFPYQETTNYTHYGGAQYNRIQERVLHTIPAGTKKMVSIEQSNSTSDFNNGLNAQLRITVGQSSNSRNQASAEFVLEDDGGRRILLLQAAGETNSTVYHRFLNAFIDFSSMKYSRTYSTNIFGQSSLYTANDLSIPTGFNFNGVLTLKFRFIWNNNVDSFSYSAMFGSLFGGTIRKS